LSFLITASLVIVAIAGLILLFLGMKYPLGKKDWPFDKERTFRYIISGILFFIIMGLIYWITRYWDYPLSGKGLFYVSMILIPILIVLGLIFPKGRKDLLQ
jgi:multisubunit Na+/H+ antiporter MnhB subunit